MVKSRRIEWVDIAKGIAILLMVIGHEIPQGALRCFIFSFHMPLFFILSGFTSSVVTNYFKFCNKQLKSFKSKQSITIRLGNPVIASYTKDNFSTGGIF